MQLSWPALWVACANAGVAVERLVGAPPVDLDDDEMRHASIVVGDRELHRTIDGDPDVIEETTRLLQRFENPVGGVTVDVDGRQLTVVADDLGALSWFERDGDIFTLGSGTHDAISTLADVHLAALTQPTTTGGALELSIDDLEFIGARDRAAAPDSLPLGGVIRHVVTVEGSRRMEHREVAFATVFVITPDGVYEVPDPSDTDLAAVAHGRITIAPVVGDVPLDAIADAVHEVIAVATGELSVEPTG